MIARGGPRGTLIGVEEPDPAAERVWTVLQRAPDRFERFAREIAAWLASV